MFCEPDVTNEQCAVSPADRMMCRGAYLGILQHACENLDCCYDNRILNAPSCFPPKSGTLLEAFSSSKQCTKCTIFVAGIFPHPLLHFPTCLQIACTESAMLAMTIVKPALEHIWASRHPSVTPWAVATTAGHSLDTRVLLQTYRYLAIFIL